jgi:putative nucleotidyltransferase with HDIG domain
MLPISRDKAIELLKSMNQTEADMNHYLESEAVMRKLALKLGEDAEYWAMLGLLHDIDWSLTRDNIQEHLTKAPQILREAGFDEKFIQIVVSHGYGWDCAGLKDKKRTEKVEFALACSETVTGLVYAYALMRGKKISDMEAKGLGKKFKDKRFAAGCNREIILECENFMKLDEFLALSIEAMKDIKSEVGLI